MSRIKSFVFYSVGHRGIFLFLLALAFIFYGVSIIRQPEAYAAFPYRYVSWNMWGYIWISTGTATMIGAFRRIDRVAFAIASVVSLLWSVRWFYISMHLPHANLWPVGMTWTVITGIILIISTWPEVHIRHETDGPPPPNEPPDVL